MNNFKIFWLLVIAHTGTAIADTETTIAVPETPIAKTAPRTFRGQISLDIQPISNLIVPATGASIGTHINNKNLIVLQYAKGSIGLDSVLSRSQAPKALSLVEDPNMKREIDGVFEDIERTDITHSITALRHRYFWSDNFYTNFGLGIKRFGINYPLNEVSRYEDLTAVVEVSKNVGMFAIGHRWVALEHFLINLEWIDIVVPFDTFEEPNSQDTGFTRKYNEFTRRVMVHVLNFSFGVVF